MNQHHAMPVLLFGLFTLEGERRILLRPNQDGQLIETRLSEAECHILTHLLLHAGKVCSKETLLQMGWGGRPISPNSLTVAIANLRRYLQSDPAELEIRSLPRKGYMLSLFVPLKERLPAGSMPPPVGGAQAGVSHAEPPLPPVSGDGESETPASGVGHWLLWINLLALAILLFLILLIRFEWLQVHCRIEQGFTVCALDEKYPFKPLTSDKPVADTLWLVAGKQAISVSKQALLQAQEAQEHDEEK